MTELLNKQSIRRLAPPSHRPSQVIDTYTRLGQGERDTIRLALTQPRSLIVLDDHLAFVIASRFSLRPVLLLDLLVILARQYNLDKQIALKIVSEVAPRYSSPFVEHTKHKLMDVTT